MNKSTINLDPATISGVVIWGVVAGILASLVLLLAGVLFTKVFLPWYEGIRYKGWDVSGLWVFSQNTSGGSYSYQMILTQKAHALLGTMTIMKSGSPSGGSGDYLQAFDITGTTWEGYVTLNLKSSDRKSVAFATSLLQMQDRGKIMAGQLVYRTSQVSQIDSETVTWTRS
jgi:hypothetical protein